MTTFIISCVQCGFNYKGTDDPNELNECPHCVEAEADLVECVPGKPSTEEDDDPQDISDIPPCATGIVD